MNRAPGIGVIAIFLVVAIQSLALCWMVWERMSLLRNGRPILVDVEPVDPRDLFRGDYVILSFPISRLTLAELEGEKSYSENMPIFVGLQAAENLTWQPFSVHKSKPAVSGEVVYLKGRVTSADCPASQGPCKTVDVHYGMESFFVPEGEGHRLEELRNERRLQIAARVAESGEGAIAGIAIDGTIEYNTPLF